MSELDEKTIENREAAEAQEVEKVVEGEGFDKTDAEWGNKTDGVDQ